MRQYFYMVAYNYDELTIPRKIFLQEHDAVRWGRREAANKLLETKDSNYEYVLYKQEITRAGELHKIKTLKPYPTKELIDSRLLGADYDIDKERC